ncbi:MAG: sulfatase, partial [Planctomycetes bacterium]|nr:sulfatase [Planctomycetota bacterium]
MVGRPSLRTNLYWTPRVFFAVWGGVFFAACLDLVLLPWLREGTTTSWDWLAVSYQLGLGSLGGLILALVTTLVATVVIAIGMRRPNDWRNPSFVVMTVALFAVLMIQNRTTLDGPAIREHEHIVMIRLGFYGGGFLLIASGTWFVWHWLRWTRRWGLAFRMVSALTLLGLSGLCYVIDARYFVGQYGHLHLQLAESVITGASFALLALLCGRTGRSTVVAFLFLAVIAGAALFLRGHGEINRARATVARAGVNLPQWMVIPETFLDALRPLKPGEITDIREILARRDQDAALAPEIERRLDEAIPQRRSMNLLIVSIDTLRADHTGFGGYSRNTTPTLDALAARSTVFERSYTPYPTSAYAYSSFFSGRYPECAPVNWALKGKEPAWPSDLTLAGLLGSAGFRSIGVSAFNAGTLKRRDVFGHLKDGFETFNPRQTIKAREARQVTDSALNLLGEAATSRFFIWVHYLDPHAPYARHANHDFGKSARDRYDSEIAHVDAEVGRLLVALEDRGLAEDTVVLVMSDHGEEFGEHFGKYHNSSLYEQQLRVPFMMHVPGLAPRRVQQIASLVDVLPTLATLFDIEDPHFRNGRCLWPAMLGCSSHDGFAFAQLHPQELLSSTGLRMVVFGGHKMILTPAMGTEEVFHLDSDPLETKNIVGRASTVAGVLRGLDAQVRTETAAIRG